MLFDDDDDDDDDDDGGGDDVLHSFVCSRGLVIHPYIFSLSSLGMECNL